MNYQELSKKITNKEYDTKLPYPKFRPDPQERVLHKDEDRLMRDYYRQDRDRLLVCFKYALQSYIESTILVNLTDEQFEVIWKLAWDKGHASGYHEVLNETFDLLDVVKVFIK